MPPSTARSYVIGRTGSFNVPTVVDVDTCLRDLRAQLVKADPVRAARIRGDLDTLLERRLEMST